MRKRQAPVLPVSDSRRANLALLRSIARSPGGITTEGSTEGLAGLTTAQVAKVQKEFASKIPLGRMGTPDDIARVALFLVSPAAAYMTGSTVVVDGGRLLS